MGISDVYYQHPDVPAEQANARQSANFGALPELQNQYMQQQAMQKQQAENDAPISPELEALFAQTAHELGRPDIAEKYSSRTRGVQAPPAQNNPTGTEMAGPRMMQNSAEVPPSNGAPGIRASTESMQYPGYAASMPQPMGQSQQPQKPMTKGDFNTFMTHAQPIAQRQNQRDIAAEANKTRIYTADQKNNLDFAKLTATEQAQHLKNLLEEKKITKAEAYHMAQIALGRDRLQSQITKWRSTNNTKDKQKILDDMDDEIRSMESEIAGISSNPLTLRMNPETARYIDGVKEEVASLKQLRVAYRSQLIQDTSGNQNPDNSEGVTIKKQEGATPPAEPQFSDQTGAKTAPPKSKYEVGKTYTLGGKKRKVLAIKPDGTLSTQVVP